MKSGVCARGRASQEEAEPKPARRAARRAPHFDESVQREDGALLRLGHAAAARAHGLAVTAARAGRDDVERRVEADLDRVERVPRARARRHEIGVVLGPVDVAERVLEAGLRVARGAPRVAELRDPPPAHRRVALEPPELPREVAHVRDVAPRAVERLPHDGVAQRGRRREREATLVVLLDVLGLLHVAPVVLEEVDAPRREARRVDPLVPERARHRVLAAVRARARVHAEREPALVQVLAERGHPRREVGVGHEVARRVALGLRPAVVDLDDRVPRGEQPLRRHRVRARSDVVFRDRAARALPIRPPHRRDEVQAVLERGSRGDDQTHPHDQSYWRTRHPHDRQRYPTRAG